MKSSSFLRHLPVAGAAALAMVSLAIACSKDSDNGVVTPPTTPVLTSVSVSPTTVAGGGSVQGTVTLSAAPTSAASVTLSSNSAAATTPGTVTVNAGATSASFTVTTSAVASSTNVTITATFGGATIPTLLTVTGPALAANFTVKALSPVQRKLSSDPAPVTILPAGSEDACPLVGAFFDCQFDGSASTAASGPIQRYIWTYFVGPRVRTEESTSPIYKPSESSCNFFGGLQTSNSGGLQFVGMRVDLQVRDAAGTLSAVKTNQNIRIFPAGQCGYGF